MNFRKNVKIIMLEKKIKKTDYQLQCQKIIVTHGKVWILDGDVAY